MTEPPRDAAGPAPRDRPREISARPVGRQRAIVDAWRLFLVHIRPSTLRKIWRRSRSGLWRVEVAEDSMRPALVPGDWLLLDPTVRRWPRRGSVVVFREPETGILAVKRVAARPGDHVRIPEGFVHLDENEAWLLGDAERSVDSRRYGPVPLDRLIGRVWFRYAPISRMGRIARR